MSSAIVYLRPVLERTLAFALVAQALHGNAYRDRRSQSEPGNLRARFKRQREMFPRDIQSIYLSGLTYLFIYEF